MRSVDTSNLFAAGRPADGDRQAARPFSSHGYCVRDRPGSGVAAACHARGGRLEAAEFVQGCRQPGVPLLDPAIFPRRSPLSIKDWDYRMSETTPSSGRYPPAPRIRRAGTGAVTLCKASSRTITISGFSALHLGFRRANLGRHDGGRYMRRLAAARSASSLAVTVAFSHGDAGAWPTNRPSTGSSPPASGLPLNRDRWLFPQSRRLFVIFFAAWLGLCVYVGGLLDGQQGYRGILSG